MGSLIDQRGKLKAPKSPERIEVSGQGSKVKEIGECYIYGARLAQAGEFSKRAFKWKDRPN